MMTSYEIMNSPALCIQTQTVHLGPFQEFHKKLIVKYFIIPSGMKQRDRIHFLRMCMTINKFSIQDMGILLDIFYVYSHILLHTLPNGVMHMDKACMNLILQMKITRILTIIAFTLIQPLCHEHHSPVCLSPVCFSQDELCPYPTYHFYFQTKCDNLSSLSPSKLNLYGNDDP